MPLVLLQPGEVFVEKYTIERLVRATELASFFIAHEGTHGPVSLQVFRSEVVESTAIRETFAVQARTANKISSDAVASIIEAGVTEIPSTTGDSRVHAYVVMPQIEGRTLGEMLEDRARTGGQVWSAALISNWLKAISEGVAAAHDAHVFHGGLEPDSILVSMHDDHLRDLHILDFGIGHFLTATRAAGHTHDPPYFGSPAALAGTPSAKGDLWSLAMLAFSLLTGTSYWGAMTNPELLDAIAAGPKEPPSRVANQRGIELSLAFDAWFFQCVGKPPGWPSVRDAAAAFQALTLSAHAATLPPPPRSVSQNPPHSRPAANLPPPPLSSRQRMGGHSVPPEPMASSAVEAPLPAPPPPLVAAPPPPRAVPSPSFSEPPKMAATPPAAPAAPPSNKSFWIGIGLGGLAVGIIVPLLLWGMSSREPSPTQASSGTSASTSLASSSSTTSGPRLSCSAEMALIPAGSVEITGENAPHKLDAFCLDLTEVTVADYSKCVDDHKCTAPMMYRDLRFADDAFCNYKHPAGRQLHPINCVNFEQASRFCESVSKRLPTEPEWQWAAQGGPEKRIFPWGDAKPSPQNVNACGLECVSNAALRGFMDWPALYRVRDDYPETAPVGVIAGGASAFKTFDMAGNVREWTSTATTPSEKGAKRFISRGGSWQEDTAENLKTTYQFKDEASSQYPSIGFRCAKSK